MAGIALVMLLFQSVCNAQLTMPKVFGDSMVL